MQRDVEHEADRESGNLADLPAQPPRRKQCEAEVFLSLLVIWRSWDTPESIFYPLNSVFRVKWSLRIIK